jgi:hypothetical protein
MKPELSDTDVDQILEGLDESTLGEWELGFVKNVRLWWVQKRVMSPKQRKRLAELWRKAHEPKRN